MTGPQEGGGRSEPSPTHDFVEESRRKRRARRWLVGVGRIGLPRRPSLHALRALMYHRVHDDSALPLSISVARFREHVRHIATQRTWSPAALDDLRAEAGRLSVRGRRLLVTFDDGYLDNYDVAWPLLHEAGLPAAVFLTVGYIGKGEPLPHDRRYGVAPERCRLMSWRHVRELADAGVGIGSHGMSHRSFTRLTRAEARAELREAKQRIEDEIGREVHAFAFPSGHARREHVALAVEAGYRMSFGTRAGVNRTGARAHLLRRNVIESADEADTLVEVLRGALDAYWLKDLRGIRVAKELLLGRGVGKR